MRARNEPVTAAVVNSGAVGTLEREPAVSSPAVASGLECRVGRARIAVPIQCIASIIELRIGRLPLAARLVGGVGYHEGRAVVCIALGRHGSEGASTFVTKALLLTKPSRVNQVPQDVPCDWALLVDDTHRLVRVTPGERGAADERLPDWIGRGRTDDGRMIGWIDVAAMLREIGGAP